MADDPVSQRFAPRRLAFALLGIVILGALMLWRAPHFAAKHQSKDVLTLSGPTMGSTFTVKALPSKSTSDAAIQAIVQRALARVDTLMSTYRDDTEISKFNADKALRPILLSPETAEVIACALKVNEESKGAYDITVGPVVNAYGFGPQGRRAPPSDAALQELRAHLGHDKLVFDPAASTLRKTDPAVIIDLNSIAPGFAADLIARGLDVAQVPGYMIEVGGEIRTKGRNAEGALWRVGIEKPANGERSVQRAVELDGLSLATSGDYRDFYEENGVRISHTIDARTGRPITHNLASVSVIHPSCMWADAYATAIEALGPEEGYAMAEILKLPALFITREATGVFKEKATPAYIERFGALNATELDKP